MNHPPPPELILHHALCIKHSRDVHKGKEHKAAEENALDTGPFLCLQHCHDAVKQEKEYRYHDENICPAGCLNILPPLIEGVYSHDETVCLGVDAHPYITEDHKGNREHCCPELELCQGDIP